MQYLFTTGRSWAEAQVASDQSHSHIHTDVAIATVLCRKSLAGRCGSFESSEMSISSIMTPCINSQRSSLIASGVINQCIEIDA